MKKLTKICSKCKVDKPLDDFYKQNDRESGRMSPCKKCFNLYTVRRWINRKIEMILHYGGECLDCGLTLSNSHYSIFEFHHRFDEKKDYNWTKIRLTSKEKMHKELDKCDLLCANCHRMRHANLNEGFPEQ